MKKILIGLLISSFCALQCKEHSAAVELIKEYTIAGKNIPYNKTIPSTTYKSSLST